MELCENTQIFVERDGEAVFDHTKIIFRDGNDYFYARTDQHFSEPSIDINTLLQINKIPIESIRPPMSPQFTPAPDPLPPNAYVKQPKFLDYGDTCGAEDIRRLILTEVVACEVLARYPHPNIAQYLGCVSERGRVKGLCYAKYPMTLSQRLEEGTPFDKALCLERIKSGIFHMHALGLIHNDVNPSNIMMDEGDNPVITGFDSCKPEGDPMGPNAGDFGWVILGAEYAQRENDFDGLLRIQQLLEGTRGICGSFEDKV